MTLLIKILLTLLILWLGIFSIMAVNIILDHHYNKHAFRKFRLRDELQIALSWPLIALLLLTAKVMDLYDFLRHRPKSKP